MTEKIIPDGYKLVAVKGLDELVYWLERCKDKGHLENCADLIEPFEAFEYRNISEESVIAAHEKAAPAAPQGTNWHAHHVIVGKAALQMVRNALRNDMERGLIVRGEMLEELDKVTYSATPAAASQPVTLTDEPPQKFVEWLEREMPPETVILNASWWAPRIYGAIIAALREKEWK